MDIHLVCLLLIMLVVGAFGGVINHFQTQNDTISQPPGTNSTHSRRNFCRCFMVGIGAALLVPLFLNMISSDLLMACRENPTKLLVFAGFCLVASISSKSFIGTVSNQVFELAKKANEKAEHANQEINRVGKGVAAVIEKETEPVPTKDYSRSKAIESVDPSSLDWEAKRVLLALCQGKYTFRSLQGISSCAELPEQKVTMILDDLVSRGLINETYSDDGKHWCVTKQGRETASSIQVEELAQRMAETPSQALGHA